MYVDENSEFFEPMPQTSVLEVSDIDDQASTTIVQESLSPIKCKFGRFGETTGLFINATTVKCTTPPTDEPADEIYKEVVVFSLAMNGQDFQEDDSEIEFTFIGTAPFISFATIVMTLLAIGFVAFAATLFMSNSYQLR